MRRTAMALTLLALVGTACSPAEPDARAPGSTTLPPSTAVSPPPTTATSIATTTTEVPRPQFSGAAPVTAFVAGSLWDLATSPPTELAEIPGNRSPESDPVWTPFGIVLLAAAGEGAPELWLIDPATGEATPLAQNVGSFAVAADRETVAWAEHIGLIGAEGSQTRLTESALPEFAPRHTLTLDGFARIAGYAGDVVVLETGDGAEAVVRTWAPVEGTLQDAPGYVNVLATSPTDPSAVLVTDANEARWATVLSDGGVLPAAAEAIDPPWDSAETRAAGFSPDGRIVALSGTRDATGERLVTFRTVLDRAVVAEIVLDDLPGRFFAPAQLAWMSNDELVLLAETWDERSEAQPHAGQRFIYQCSLQAVSCERATEIVYEPRDYDEVALVAGSVAARTVADPVPGWRRIDIDPALTGNATPVAAFGEQGVVAIAGCHRSGPSDWFPMWVSTDGDRWDRAEGPTASCLEGIVSTEFGFVTWGRQGVFVSSDAMRWEPLDGPWGDEPGWTQFVATTNTVTIVLRSQAAQNETTVASLWTTTDGVTWQSHPESARLFDSSDVAAVSFGGPGLVAVGASPGGEFVPTAAVWTTADGAAWDLVSPRGEGFADATMFDVRIAGPGLVAVGTDWEGPAFWWSDDGTTWTRSPGTDEPVPEFGHIVAEDIALVEGIVYATGFMWQAGGDGAEPRLWMSADGRSWEPADYAEYAGRLLFGVTAFEAEGGVDRGIAFWPPPSSMLESVVELFITSE